METLHELENYLDRAYRVKERVLESDFEHSALIEALDSMILKLETIFFSVN